MTFTMLLSLISTISFVIVGFFAGVQLQHLNKQHSRESALHIMNSAQTPFFMDALHIIFSLPEDLPKKEIEDRLGDKMNNILFMFGTFESIGFLVHKHEISLKMVHKFLGGAILLFWKKFKHYFMELRQSTSRENHGEWVQWLAEQLEKREASILSAPAYIAYSDWKEKK